MWLEPFGITIAKSSVADSSVAFQHVCESHTKFVKSIFLVLVKPAFVGEVSPFGDVDVEVKEVVTVSHPAKDTDPVLLLTQIQKVSLFPVPSSRKRQGKVMYLREIAFTDMLDPPFADFATVKYEMVFTVVDGNAFAVEVFVDSQQREVDILIVDNASVHLSFSVPHGPWTMVEHSATIIRQDILIFEENEIENLFLDLLV